MYASRSGQAYRDRAHKEKGTRKGERENSIKIEISLSRRERKSDINLRYGTAVIRCTAAVSSRCYAPVMGKLETGLSQRFHLFRGLRPYHCRCRAHLT